MDHKAAKQTEAYEVVESSYGSEIPPNEQSKQDLQAYLDNLLEDIFSQLPGS
ncbi:hypothetical protein [Motilimonas eburnea]|uniref:hypothetical protein n=1 Tax=Motilimonas eburnea TaxID=1737488 RepID=UPI001E3C55CF|nr:hypothetical protein [Motilimonas eburnea]MCE2570108.1 hypothetical protein [Motilimonas eburnea]